MLAHPTRQLGERTWCCKSLQAGRTHAGEGQHPRGDGELFPVTRRLLIEDGRITRVRVTFDHSTLLQAGGDPRPRKRIRPPQASL
jgi:hypothetical protein